MGALDFQTLIVVNFIVNVINFLAMAILWRRYGHRFGGLGFWLGAMSVHVVGIGLILLRDQVHHGLSICIANALLTSSMIFMLIGFQRFAKTHINNFPVYLGFGVFLLVLYYYTMIQDSIVARTLSVSLIIVFVYSRTCILLFSNVTPYMRSVLLVPGIVVAGYVVASLARVLLILTSAHDSRFFRSDLADSAAIASYIALHICLMISLTLALTRRLMDEVKAQEEKFAKAFHSSPYAIAISRVHDGRIIEINNGFSDIFGHTRDEALLRTFAELDLAPLDAGTRLPEARRSPGGGGGEANIQVRRKSGEPVVAQRFVAALTIDGEACLVSSLADVTEESRLKRRLEEMATKDALTGLPNRHSFYETFTAASSQARRHKAKMCVLSLDLDDFKVINDTLGHAAGDAILVEAARRFLSCLRREDVVARFGGDEFVILLSHIQHPADGMRVMDKIRAALRAPLDIDGREAAIRASIGMALYPDDGQGVDELLKISDDRLYQDKRKARRG